MSCVKSMHHSKLKIMKRLCALLLVATAATTHAAPTNNSLANNLKFKLYEKMMGLYKAQNYYDVRKAVDNPDKSNTVLGKDSNQNGIRDDVEGYINKTYTNVGQNNAAKQLARSFQAFLTVDTNNKGAVKATSENSSRAISCVFDYFKMGNTARNTSLVGDISVLTINTYQRHYVYDLYNHALDGTVSSLPKKDYCDF